MKKVILITMILSSCAIAPEKPIKGSESVPKRKADRILDCIRDLLKRDVKPLEANQICQEVYK